MLTPSNVTLAEYNNAILAGKTSHARLVFPVQNITLTDNDISVNGGITLTTVMNPDEDITFGKAIMSELQVRLLNGSVFTGFDWTEEFHLDIGVNINNATEWVTVGYFKGKKPKRTVRTDIIHFLAYDRMQAFDCSADDFLSGITYPVTLADLYHSLCSYVGMAYVAGDEIADSLTLSYAESPFTNGITCRAVLAWIAEACGCTARITADGKVKLAWYTDCSNAYSITRNHYFDIDIDEIVCAPIDSVDIDSTDEEVSGFYYPLTGIKPYEILDNPLLLSLSTEDKETFVTEIIARFAAFGSYTPMTISPVGNWMVEVGDIIEIEDSPNHTVSMPVFNRILHWAGASVDEYECVGNDERVSLAESAKDEYALGGRLGNYYPIRSGVDIDEDGITVSGSRYVKIISGGVLDVDSQNFKLNSETGEMISGNWHFQGKGAYCLETDQYGVKRLFELGDLSGTAANYKAAIYPRLESRHPQNPSAASNLYYGSINFVAGGGRLQIANIFGLNSLVPNDGGSDLFGGGDIALMPVDGGDAEVYIGWEDAYSTQNAHRYQVHGVYSKHYGGEGVKNNRSTTEAGYVLDARQGKILDDKKANCIELLSSDNTMAKIWTKVSAMEKNKTYTLYANAAAVNVLSDGVRNNTLVGVITRTGDDTFLLLVRMGTSGNNFAIAYWSGMTSTLPGTYSENNITGAIGQKIDLSAIQNDLNITSSGNVLDARAGKTLNDKITSLVPSRVLASPSLQTAQTTRTLSLPDGGRFLFVCPTSSSNQRNSFVAIVSVSSQGTVHIAKLYEGAGVTVSGTTNKFIITLDSAANSFPAIMAFATNATHLASITDV